MSRDFVINSEGHSEQDERSREGHKITRETPDSITDAAATDNRSERWKVIRTWAEAHPKRSALKSFDWLTATLMSFDDAVV